MYMYMTPPYWWTEHHLYMYCGYNIHVLYMLTYKYMYMYMTPPYWWTEHHLYMYCGYNIHVLYMLTYKYMYMYMIPPTDKRNTTCTCTYSKYTYWGWHDGEFSSSVLKMSVVMVTIYVYNCKLCVCVCLCVVHVVLCMWWSYTCNVNVLHAVMWKHWANYQTFWPIFTTLVLLPIYFVYSLVSIYQTFTRFIGQCPAWLAISTPLTTCMCCLLQEKQPFLWSMVNTNLMK